MTFEAGPDITTNGLVLHYDIADESSYPGDATTNLLTSNPLPTYPTITGYTRIGGTGSLIYDTDYNAILWTQNTYDVWGAYLNNDTYFNGTLNTLSQYTYSFEWKTDNTFLDSAYTVAVVQGNGVSPALGYTGITSNSIYLGDGWNRFSLTFTPLNSGAGAYARVNVSNQGVTGKFWLRKMQLEEKSYRTPFVVGTRSATVIDLSGNSNNGTPTGAPIYNSSNSGSLVFDGINDYIVTPSISLTSYTFELFVKATGDSLSGATGYNTLIGYTNARRLLYATNGNLLAQTGFGNFYSTLNATRNTWNCIAYTYDASITTSTWYINGVSDATSTTAGAGTWISALYIGSYNADNYWMNGNIASVKVYNRALTPNEISKNFNAQRGRYGI